MTDYFDLNYEDNMKGLTHNDQTVLANPVMGVNLAILIGTKKVVMQCWLGHVVC